MKKQITVFMLFLVALGMMPFAAAANTAASDRMKATDSNYETAGNESDSVLARSRIRNESMDSNGSQIRERAENRAETAKQRYQTAKEKYQDAKERYAQAKEKVEDSRGKYQSCKGNQTEECDSVRAKVKSNTKDMLENSAERITAMIEKIKLRINSSESFNESEAEEMMSKLDARIADIQEAKSVIENLDNESTEEEIREAVSTIQQAWNRSQGVMKLQVGKLANEKIGGIVVKSEKLSERLQNAVETLKEDGEDTSEIESFVQDFNANVENAKQLHEMAREQYQKSAEGEDADEAMKQANQYMKEAHSKLKEAHSILVKIQKQIRETRKGMSALEETEGNESEEADEE